LLTFIPLGALGASGAGRAAGAGRAYTPTTSASTATFDYHQKASFVIDPQGGLVLGLAVLNYDCHGSSLGRSIVRDLRLRDQLDVIGLAEHSFTGYLDALREDRRGVLYSPGDYR
jgi:hypothetical protein